MKSLLLPVFLAAFLDASAADWPAYRGPTHDGIASEKILFQKWNATGPAQVWKTPTTNGFSSFAVAGGRAFTLVQRSVEGVNAEVCIALDAQTGRELWAANLGYAKYQGGGDSGTRDNSGGDGPRSTPCADGNLVYALDTRLVLTCLNAATGREVWKHDIVAEFAGKNIGWGSAASPLVEGELVFVAGGGPGQSLLAFNKKNGSVMWKAGDEKMTHATPIAATILGTRQIVFFTQSGLVSVLPQTGQPLWKYAFPYNTSTAASPVVSNDIVYCSAGYGVGAGACRIAKSGTAFTATEIWRKPNDLINHWSTPVVKDGFLYGMFSFKKYGEGPLKCVEIATGTEKWSQPGFGAGQVILVGNQVLALSDKGEIVLIETTPAAYRETARAKVVGGKCWSTPAFSNGRAYVRSTTEGACVQLAPAATAAR